MRPLPLTKAAIIGVLLWLLAGCSAVRLAYDNGALLGWWWLDGYIDFSSEQAPQAREAVARWFAWHRATQLEGYATLLAEAQQEVTQPTTAARACRWLQRARGALEPALQRAMQDAADLVPALGDAQWRHLEQKFAKNNAALRKDFLAPDLDKRRKAAVRRVLERAEMLYGSLDPPQRELIAAGVDASPFDAQAWIDERMRRQRDTVQTLRRLAAERPARGQIVTALQQLTDRAEHSPDPAYAAYQAQLVDFNCAFAARLHNATTPAQRRVARERLQGWEQDLRSLAALSQQQSLRAVRAAAG